jgi:ketosteroid isomerase-like protein
MVAGSLVVILSLPGLAAATPIVARQTTEPDPEVTALIEAERGFCAKAAATSIRDAFLDNFANEAIVFRPGPINGKDFYRDRPSNPGPILTWWPTYAELSGAGDLGWTTGPWEYRAAKDKPVEAWGHFATVWQKQLDGKWRVLLDEGHSCAKPAPESLAWARDGGKGIQVGDLGTLAAFNGVHTQLIAADQAYSQALGEKGLAAALAAWADEDVRLYREDKPALVGASAASQALAHEWDRGATGWDTKVGAIAKSFDLGFSYGTVEVPARGKDKAESRKIFRVWRRGADGPWKLVLDVTNPMPSPPPAPRPPKGAPSR